MPHLRAIWAIAVASILALSLPVRVALAQETDAFLVRDLQVDVTAENVNLARDQAFAQAQRAALGELLQRLTAQADWTRLPQVSDAQLDDLVLDVGVDQEKRSEVRYIATLSVRFKPEPVEALLREANIPYGEWRGRPVIVLPVLKTETGPLLWEKVNPWRDAWQSAAAQGLVPLIVPAPPKPGTGLDDALQAATAAPEQIDAFAKRYETQDLLILTASATTGADGKVALDVAIAGAGPLAASVSGARQVQGESGEAATNVMRRAVIEIAAAVNDAYKAGNLLSFAAGDQISVIVPLGGFADWIALREKLARSIPVRAWEVASISQKSASLVLHYVGDQKQLETVFVQNGLVLSWAEDHWLLQNVVAKPGAGKP